MNYFLVAMIVIALLAIVFMLFWRLRPTRLEPIALANQLLRQPERFFVIVPWYLFRCRQSHRDPLEFIQKAARHWEGMGNFKLQASTLVAFAELESVYFQASSEDSLLASSRECLKRLLSSLFGEEPNPLVLAATESESNQHLAVKCLEVVNLVMGASHEGRGAEKKRLPAPNHIKNLLQLAEEAERRKSKLTLRVFGDFDDDSILKEWLILLKSSGELIDPNYKTKFKSQTVPTKQNGSKAETRKRQEKKPKNGDQSQKKPRKDDFHESDQRNSRDPRVQEVPHLWFIKLAVWGRVPKGWSPKDGNKGGGE